MRFLNLTLLCFMLNAVSADPGLEYLPSSPAKIVKSITANRATTGDVKTLATNIIFQSKDGGQTWQDISDGLPEYGQPEDFFAGESEVYIRVKSGMYRSMSDLNTPVWEKEKGLDLRGASIAFNRSGVLAFDYGGQVYKKMPPAGTWVQVYTNFKKNLMRTIFETADGTVFLGSDNGLYRSADRGESWKQVQNEGWVMNMVEAEGVLLATGQKGIMRSTDQGEHWDWVINEGGVGIAIERIKGGFAAISYSKNSNSRRIRVSLDSGKTWTAIDYWLPGSLSISSIKQVGKYLLCGLPDGIFRSSDMGQTWNMVHPRVGKPFEASVDSWNNGKVFELFVSGNTLYAVAKDSGC